MDALEIMMNIDKVKPYFQPIISAENQLVIGYEVLGRIELDGETKSLGRFFQDQSVPDEFQMEVDNQIQTLAFEQFIQHENKDLLFFINCNANIIMKDHGEELISKLHDFEEKGISYNQIVIEITEHDYEGDISQLTHLLLYLQSLGIKIAIDDVGRGGGNIDRIAILNPDIVKVDLIFLQNETVPQSYNDALYSLSLLARKMGATLLFEGIGQLNQLHSAWRNGGRYYQGHYLFEPAPSFIPRDQCKEKLKKEFHQFINLERKKLRAQYQLSEQLATRLQEIFKRLKKSDDHDQIVSHVAEQLSDVSFRIYICDEDGFQQSQNVVKDNNGKWVFQPEYRFKNWSWRSYFLENIMRMSKERNGILSDLYSDIETNEMIRTYSYPINNLYYLFIDIPYTYLYEQDGLL